MWLIARTMASVWISIFTKFPDVRCKPRYGWSILSDEQVQVLVSWVKTTNPAHLKQIRAYVIEQFGIKYTTEAIRKLLHKQKLKLIWPKVVPGNPPSEEVQKIQI